MRSVEIKPKNIGTRQLFDSPVLERLSRTSIFVPLAIFFFYSLILLFWSSEHTNLSVWATLGLFFFGLFSFTWIEYMLHRYVFHMSTFTKVREKMQYTLHGVHHEFPKDKSRLAMPPLLSVTISTILLLICRVILGDHAFAFLPGLLSGYALYLSIHYMVHTQQPPKNFLRILWVNHSIHHYKNGECLYGVSSPLWDYIYRTTSVPVEN